MDNLSCIQNGIPTIDQIIYMAVNTVDSPKTHFWISDSFLDTIEIGSPPSQIVYMANPGNNPLSNFEK